MKRNEAGGTGAEAHASASCLIVVDLEATCWEKDPPHPNETIEIGAVAWRTGQGIVGEFMMFVRPKLAPALTDSCRKLTTITQSNVDAAARFPEAYNAFQLYATSRSFERNHFCIDPQWHITLPNSGSRARAQLTKARTTRHSVRTH